MLTTHHSLTCNKVFRLRLKFTNLKSFLKTENNMLVPKTMAYATEKLVLKF